MSRSSRIGNNKIPKTTPMNQSNRTETGGSLIKIKHYSKKSVYKYLTMISDMKTRVAWYLLSQVPIKNAEIAQNIIPAARRLYRPLLARFLKPADISCVLQIQGNRNRFGQIVCTCLFLFDSFPFLSPTSFIIASFFQLHACCCSLACLFLAWAFRFLFEWKQSHRYVNELRTNKQSGDYFYRR